MRVAALVAALAEGDAEAWILGISHAAELAHGQAVSQASDGVDAVRALVAITAAAGSPRLSYAVRQRLYEAALRADRPEIARLFFSASPPSALPELVAKQSAPERVLEQRGRPLTLGERRALARTHRRDRLALVAKDPHPAVVSVLLGNPSLTEPEVVTMAASRRAVPEALTKIAEHTKWSVRIAVKRALVLNPATPLATALRLATTLPSGDLAEILELATLSPLLREHIRELIERRRRPRGNPTPLS